jgi:alkanesulfonate monooxygenase SsuD/methylene tetrahydromethanopterin reductase-like flavin-dependent oxidoreductase (luciferase family)
LHDILDLDRRGIPGGFVASEEFVEAARAQAESLGFDPHKVFVPHPIQDRTDEEMQQIAEDTFEAVLGMILAERQED